MVKLLHAVRDPTLQATIVRSTPLLYTQGADLSLDRPTHVRAGSSLTWLGDSLVVIQDDANFLVLIEPQSLEVTAIALAVGEGGLRQFDDLRGNKQFKLDLEACTTIPALDGDLLLAFGSGSTSRREQILIVQERDIFNFILEQADALYTQLRKCQEFSGSELNIEGAIYNDGKLCLFNRGNGAPQENLLPVNATCDLDPKQLQAYLQKPEDGQPPEPQNICQYDLGSLDGLKLSFTDATITPYGIVFSATAEASPDATTDGVVSGSVLGILDANPRWIELRTLDGSLFTGKVEGVCISRKNKEHLYLVIDTDNPVLPCELCEVEFTSRSSGVQEFRSSE